MLNLSCVICAELFRPADDVHVTTCGHLFHINCLKQWLERSKSCPQCRNKCTDRNIFRVYFNLANLDVSSIDVGSLHEQLDNANLQVKMKEQSLNKAEQQVKDLKETQKKCMKTIAGLEQKLQKNDFLILSYNEQLKLLKADAKLLDVQRKEVESLKRQIETLEGMSSILTATTVDAEKLLKNESDPMKLSVWVATLRRELRQCESKKTDQRNVLKVVQNNLRKEIELKKIYEERISQLESENYQLNEKIKNSESAATKAATLNTSSFSLNNAFLNTFCEDKRLTISPATKDNVRKIEESNSPYLNIKSSSVGLVPLFKRNHEGPSARTDPATAKMSVVRLSPIKHDQPRAAITMRKASSDLGAKHSYSIFKKPRLGMAAAAASAGTASLMKPLGPNFVFNGFGGSEKVDPFAQHSDDDEEDQNANRAKKLTATNGGKTVPKAGSTNFSSRLKTGGLRNFKVTK